MFHNIIIHYRLHPFVEKMIHDIMTPNMIRNCFQELDIYGEHILHIVSKSKASGFARYFIRTKNHHPRSSSSHNHDRNKQKKKNKQKANHNHNHPRHNNNNDHYQLCMNNNSYCKYLFNERLLKNPISNNNNNNNNNNNKISRKISHYTFSQLNDATGVDDLNKLINYGLKVLPNMLDRKKWLNTKNYNGETPFLIGCRFGRAAVIETFLKLNKHNNDVVNNHLLIDLNVHGKIWNQTCFHLIASREHLNILQVFEKHYDINYHDDGRGGVKEINNKEIIINNNNDRQYHKTNIRQLKALILDNKDRFNRNAFDIE